MGRGVGCATSCHNAVKVGAGGTVILRADAPVSDAVNIYLDSGIPVGESAAGEFEQLPVRQLLDQGFEQVGVTMK